MGILFEGVTLGSFLALAGLIIVLLAVNEVTRRNKVVSLVIFCVLPVVLGIGVYLGLLGSPTGKTWFAWVKVVSALAAVYGFMVIRYTKYGKSKFAYVFPGAILALNIAEAVYREFQVYATVKSLTMDAGGILIQGGVWNLMNAVAGILCILTLTGFGGIRVSKDATRDMIWPDMTWLYIAGYTIWNFTYVYNCISNRSMYAGFAILFAALIAELFFKRGAWLQHRAQILSVYAMFSLSVDFQSKAYFQVLPLYQTNMLMSLSVISLVFNIGVFGYVLYAVIKHKKKPLKEEVYSHTVYYQKSLAMNHLKS